MDVEKREEQVTGGGISRRGFLKAGGVGAAAFAFGGGLAAVGARVAQGQEPDRTEGYGPLVPMGDLALPEGFSYKIISRQGEPMSDGNPTPGIFDGMAAFRGRRGSTVLIRNHENRRRPGEIPVIVPDDKRYDQDPTYNAGNTKLVVDRNLNVTESFAVLGGTTTNCAGGPTPWGSWIACEEVVDRGFTGTPHGYIFEIDASTDGPVEARPVTAAGRFVHEAVAWLDGALYLTEDKRDDAFFYRYLPEEEPHHRDSDDDDDGRGRGRRRDRDDDGRGRGRRDRDDDDDGEDRDDDDGDRDDDDNGGGRSRSLADTNGTLQALKIRGVENAVMDTFPEVGRRYRVEWVTIDEPNPPDDTDNTPLAVGEQAKAKGAAIFDREEGAWVGNGKVYFDCTEGGEPDLGQVFEYDPRLETLTLIYESNDATTLQNPDNIVVVPRTGDIFLQEDGAGEQFIRGLTPEGEIYDFAQTITNSTEFCGGCFSPDGRVFFVNQQGERGGPVEGPQGGNAVTYAITGPFQRRRGNRGNGRGNGRRRDRDDD